MSLFIIQCIYNLLCGPKRDAMTFLRKFKNKNLDFYPIEIKLNILVKILKTINFKTNPLKKT